MLETDNYEKFKKDVLSIAKIDLNSYKEKQMRRRINTLITKNNIKTYDEYVTLIKKDKEKFEQFINFLFNHWIRFHLLHLTFLIINGCMRPAEHEFQQHIRRYHFAVSPK